MSILTGINIIVATYIIMQTLLECIKAAHGIVRDTSYSVNFTPLLVFVIITVILNIALTYEGV